MTEFSTILMSCSISFFHFIMHQSSSKINGWSSNALGVGRSDWSTCKQPRRNVVSAGERCSGVAGGRCASAILKSTSSTVVHPSSCHGGSAVASCSTVHPTLQMSEGGPGFMFLITSGAMKYGVPVGNNQHERRRRERREREREREREASECVRACVCVCV